MAVGAAVIAAAAEAGGIVMLATGQVVMGLLPVVLSPLAWTALVTGVAFIGWRSLDHDSPKLRERDLRSHRRECQLPNSGRGAARGRHAWLTRPRNSRGC